MKKIRWNEIYWINYSSLTILCDSLNKLILSDFVTNCGENQMSSVYIEIGKENTAKMKYVNLVQVQIIK